MTWLRFLNPFYTLKLERSFRAVVGMAHQLADSAKVMSESASKLAVDDAQSLREGERALQEAAAGIRNVREGLGAVADSMACGRTAEAKVLVDAIIFLIDGGKR